MNAITMHMIIMYQKVNCLVNKGIGLVSFT